MELIGAVGFHDIYSEFMYIETDTSSGVYVPEKNIRESYTYQCVPGWSFTNNKSSSDYSLLHSK